jgi:hypothetical protein
MGTLPTRVMRVKRQILLSLAVFAGLIILTALLSGGRFIFGVFLLPLSLLPLLFGRNRPKN